MLGRLGLDLAGAADVGHKRQVDEERVFAAQLDAQLADSLDKGQALDVADRAADLHQRDVGRTVELQDRLLYGVGDMRDHLHRAAQIFAPALLHDDAVVDAARGVVVPFPHDRVGEALVVPHVQVGLGAVIRDIHLAMLERVHGAGVDVDIGIELLEGDGQASRLQESADGSGGQPLAQRGEHAAGDKNEFGFPAARYLHGMPLSVMAKKELAELYTMHPLGTSGGALTGARSGGRGAPAPPAGRRSDR